MYMKLKNKKNTNWISDWFLGFILNLIGYFQLRKSIVQRPFEWTKFKSKVFGQGECELKSLFRRQQSASASSQPVNWYLLISSINRFSQSIYNTTQKSLAYEYLSDPFCCFYGTSSHLNLFAWNLGYSIFYLFVRIPKNWSFF